MPDTGKHKKTKKDKDKSIDRICSETWDTVYRYVYSRVQNRQEAEDITQETYVKALSRWRKWDSWPEKYTAYLKTTALNVIRDRWRKSKRIGAEVDLEAVNPLEIAMEDPSAAAGQRLVIEDALRRLGQEQRSVIELRIIKGFSVSRTAGVMGKTESAVRVMQYRALQYTVTYTNIDFGDAIPGELLVLEVPDGYNEIDNNPEQLVSSMQEADEAVGFNPRVPVNVPTGFTREGTAIIPGTGLVKIYYTARDMDTRVVIVQGKADGEFKRASTAVFAEVNGSPAEVQSPVQKEQGILAGAGPYAGMAGISSVRWRQDGYEYAVIGDARLEELIGFIEGLAGGAFDMPSADEKPLGVSQVKVSVDMEAEQNEQKSVDAGHMPWRLDPTAQTLDSTGVGPFAFLSARAGMTVFLDIPIHKV